jgi:dUTP pyrophosphatase
MTAPQIRLQRLYPLRDRDLPLPRYMTPGAAGADVFAALEQPLELQPHQRAAVPTGLAVEIPQGWEIQVRPRSGLALRDGVTVLNAPGTIDSDYRGEVRILLVNLGVEPITLRRGDRIAQWVVAPAPQAEFVELEELASTSRGAGGFGSTGGA